MQIEKKYLELIHKDIDKIISPSEKILLEKYLYNNTEALEYYNELNETEKLLDSLPDPEPSENLKKMILNSIDYNRYAPQGKRNLFKNYAAGHKSGYSLSFSLVVISGLILIGLFISNPNLITVFDRHDISGTMGLVSTEQVDILKINTPGFSGTIRVIKGIDPEEPESKNIGFDVNLNAAGTYKLEIRYNPASAAFKKLLPEHIDKLSADKQEGLLVVKSGSDISFSVLFSSTEDSENFHLELSGAGSEVYEKIIFVK